jgi:hypothetical protein
VLRGRSLKLVRASEVQRRTLDSLSEYETVLAEVFGIELPEVARLWQKVVARHEALFPQ